jgi:hypothetical protein
LSNTRLENLTSYGERDRCFVSSQLEKLAWTKLNAFVTKSQTKVSRSLNVRQARISNELAPFFINLVQDVIGRWIFLSIDASHYYSWCPQTLCVTPLRVFRVSGNHTGVTWNYPDLGLAGGLCSFIELPSIIPDENTRFCSNTSGTCCAIRVPNSVELHDPRAQFNRTLSAVT